MKKIGIEKDAYQKFLEANGNMEKVYLNALELGLAPKVFLDYVKTYIDKFDVNCKYEQIFYVFRNTVSEENNIISFRNSKLSILELEKEFSIYIMKHFYNTEEFEELILKFKKCIRSLKRNLGKIKPSDDKNSKSFPKNDIDERQYIYACKIIEKFAKSSFSRERFIIQNKLSYRDFNTYLSIVQKSNYVINEAYKRKIENDSVNSEENMTQDVFKLLNLIKTKNAKLSLIDFFISTNYGFDELKKHADKILNPIDARTFRMNLTLLKTCDVCDNSQITSLFNDKFIISIYNIPIVVDEDTKSIALEFLMKNDIPISAQTFKEAIVLNLANNLNNQSSNARTK